MVELHGAPGAYDAVVFLQTIEHVQDPVAVLEHFRSLLAPGGAVFVSTPNLLTLAPAGADKSSNPWHIREYRAAEFRQLCATVFSQVELLGLFHARKLALHARALALGWDSVHARLRLTKPSTTGSRPRSPPATSRCAHTGSMGRSTSWLSAGRELAMQSAASAATPADSIERR